MTIIKSMIVLVSFSCLMACSQSKESSDFKNTSVSGAGGGMELNSEAADLDAAPANESVSTVQKQVTEQKLIKNGEISFETKSIKDTKLFLQTSIAKYQGYIANEKIEDYRVNPTEILTIRIPNTSFDKIINEISNQVGEFDSKRISIDDVTAEFMDVEARLKNKKQLEGKYQELLAKANNMEDILKIEKEISLIREDIESTEGRLRYLNNQVGYSTLIITYYEKKVTTTGFHFLDKIVEALSSGGIGLLWFIIGLVQLWPMWIIGGIIWYIIYKIVKRQKNKKIA